MAWRETIYSDIDPMRWIQRPVWRGVGSLSGYYMWYIYFIPTSGMNNIWVISDKIGFDFKVDGADATGSWYDYNGERYWITSAGNYLWYSKDEGGWIISNKLGACTNEVWVDNHDYLNPIMSIDMDVLAGAQSGIQGVQATHVDDVDGAETVECEADVTGMTWSPYGNYPGPGTWEVNWETTSDYDGSGFTIRIYDYEYRGNAWWGVSDNVEGLYEARGSMRGNQVDAYHGTPKKVVFEFEGFQKERFEPTGGLQGIDNSENEGKSGVYRKITRTAVVKEGPDAFPGGLQGPRGSVEDTITEGSEDDLISFGCPQWKDQNDNKYVRSVEKDNNDNWWYGAIHHDGIGWVIGMRNSPYGWYEGKEPQFHIDVTFVAKKIQGGVYPGNTNIVISFDKFIECEANTKIYVGETSLWL